MALVSAWTVCFVLAFFHSAVAREFVVGGRNGWVVPSGVENQTLTQWAGKNRFLVGDTLLFNYNPSEDSVLQVTAPQYDACNTSSPIASYKGGNTVVKLPSYGPFHFISGNRSNCQKGEKVIIVVLSLRNRSHGAPAPTPASPGPSVVARSPSFAPAPTPKVSSSSPSPAPVVPSQSPSSSPAPSSSPSPVVPVSSPSSSPALSPPSPLTATPSSSPSLSPRSTATPSASQNAPTGPAPPPSASPPAPVSALNLVMPLLFLALKILTAY